MNSEISNTDSPNLKTTNILIVIALLMMPFTLIRIGFVGFGEIFFVFFSLYFVFKKKHNILKNDFVFSKFWLFFLPLSLIGFTYNVVFLGHLTGTFEGAFFDFASYVIVFSTLYFLENYIKLYDVDVFFILQRVFYYSCAIFIPLFILSLFFDSFLGISLRFNGRFVPFAKNLHQTAMYLVSLPFLGVLLLKKEETKLRKTIIISLIFSILFLIVATGSFKAISGLLISFPIFVIVSFFKLIKKNFKVIFIIFLIFIFLLISTYFFDFLISKMIQLFLDNDYEDGRLFIYTQAIEVIKNSPFLGHGTGSHIWDGTKYLDAHQTIFTVLLQAGVFGLFFFFKLVKRILVVYFKNPTILAAFIPTFMYLLGGDILRKLPTWIMLLLFYYYIINSEDKKPVNTHVEV